MYTTGSTGQTLVLHWDGSQWSVIPSVNIGFGTNQLTGLTAVSATDIWAVGYEYSDFNQTQTLIEHWDGTQWTIIASPNRGAGINILNSVDALTASDAWAVGYFDPLGGGTRQSVILHWDGTQWLLVANTPNGGLQGVSAAAANDVWAVGGTPGSNPQTLTTHWDGTIWSVIPNPSPGAGSSYFEGVVDNVTNDTWAAGYYQPPGGGATQMLLEHWDGSQWTGVPNADLGVLLGIGRVSSVEIWAVGFFGNYGSYVTRTEHYVSRCATPSPTQTETPSPTPSPTQTVTPLPPPPSPTLTATPLPPTPSPTQTVTPTVPASSPTLTTTPLPPTPSPTSTATLAWTSTPGAAATPSATASPAGTASASPTATAPAPSQTPLATPTTPAATASSTAPPGITPTAPRPTATACSIHFSDVHESDYFYQPVLYLACHAVVSGYADGTFRPYNQTTRSQQLKIVVLGFGLPIQTPVGGDYTFADVPPTHPFFAYVETAVAHGIVGGYACGGPGEPCDGQHRRYFRPYVEVTRGQLAKIVMLGAGFPLIDPATATFADVPPGSAFYTFVETASCRGILSGYSCGGPGEPCDGQHRPYYRPGNNATRGQIAKIAYGAITNPGVCGTAGR